MTLYLVPAGIAGLAALWCGGWLADRFGRLLPLLVGAGAAALALALLTHLNQTWEGAIAAVFGAAGLALTLPASTAALLDEINEDHRGLLLGGMMAVQGLAQAVGPLLGGVLLAAGSATLPFAAAAATAWLAIPLAVLYASAPRRDGAAIVIGYTPLTRLLSEASVRAHALHLQRSVAVRRTAATGDDRERHLP